MRRAEKMSAAAVVIIRIKHIFVFLRERGAVTPASALPTWQVPYSDRWYFERLVHFGAVKTVGNRCYLDEVRAEAYLRRWRKRGLTFTALALAAFGLFWLIWAWI